MLAQNLLLGYGILEFALFGAIAISGLVGAFFAATTRDDAYPAGDRQTKLIWVAILVASAFVVFTRFPFLSWVGMVAIGVYWFDVRPHLRSLVSGSGSW